MNKCRAPQTDAEFEHYYQLRWQILRKPWQQPLGSEQDELEGQSYHRMLVTPDNSIVAVGRLHLVDQHHAQIRYMAVAEIGQGKGYGAKVLAELERLATMLGVIHLELNAREIALGFYQKLGYQSLGPSHLLYNEIQHFKMHKILDKKASANFNLAQELQQTWHQTIPMSKAMNVQICHFDEQELRTSSDLLFNKNLHNTMFAGSIYTLATLTGWGWVYCQLALHKQQADIVLADANIRYHAPIKGVAIARTAIELVQDDAKRLATSNKARFTITVEISCGDQVVARFVGLYVDIATKAAK